MNVNMLKGSPVKAVLRFSLPLMLGNLFQLLYNLADSVTVGRFVSSEALAAVGVTAPMNTLLVGFAFGLTTGFSIPVAEAFGAGDIARVKKAFGNAVFLSFTLSAGLTLLAVSLSRPLLQLIDTPAEILDSANTYAVIMYSSIVFMMFYNMMASMLRALGDSTSPLLFLILSSLCNILLDLLFVLVLHRGIVGVAVASVIGNAISVLLCIGFIYKKHPELYIRLSDLRPQKSVLHALLRMGVPMALQMSITAVGSMILQSAVNTCGAYAVAAITAGTKVENIVNIMLSGLGVGLSTFVAQNRGAKQFARILTSVRRIFLLDLALSLGASVVLWCFGKSVCRIFVGADATVILDFADTYLKTLACFYWALSVLFVFRNLLQGLGYGYTSVIAGAAELLGRMLIAFVLASRFGFSAICLAGPAAWILADIPLVAIYGVKKRKLKQRIAETQ